MFQGSRKLGVHNIYTFPSIHAQSCLTILAVYMNILPQIKSKFTNLYVKDIEHRAESARSIYFLLYLQSTTNLVTFNSLYGDVLVLRKK